MTRVVIKKLIFDENNLEHVKKHNVSREEIEKAGKNFLFHRKTHTGRYLAVGRVGLRIITIVIRRESVGIYYPVTARDASKKERKDLYEKKKSRIPKFKTYEEEAHFWDIHNVTDFVDETEDVEIIFELDKPRDETLIVRLQKDFKERLEKEARSKGLNISTLARMWLMEKLQSSKSRS